MIEVKPHVEINPYQEILIRFQTKMLRNLSYSTFTEEKREATIKAMSTLAAIQEQVLLGEADV